jgi:beta-1,4-mannosyltransferase
VGAPTPQEEARRALGLPPGQKVCLMFGLVRPYKGIEDVVRLWSAERPPHRLAVVGAVTSEDYAAQLSELARDNPAVDLRFSSTLLDNDALRAWHSAADCAIFNYHAILSSGAAPLARAFGLPALVPRTATTLDLGEPHPHVVRFDCVGTDFRAALERALAVPPDYALAADWRARTSWSRVAEVTAPVYRSLVGKTE